MSERRWNKKMVNLEKMIIWWVFIISAASTHPLSRYLFFCFNAIENRFNFISFRPGSFIRSSLLLTRLFFLSPSDTNFIFVHGVVDWMSAEFRFSFFPFLFLCFCNLQSLPIFKKRVQTGWFLSQSVPYFFTHSFTLVSFERNQRMSEVFCRHDASMKWVLHL